MDGARGETGRAGVGRGGGQGPGGLRGRRSRTGFLEMEPLPIKNRLMW